MKAALLILFGALLGAFPARADEAPFGGAVRFEQRVGNRLPLAAEFRDSGGARHALGDYFRGRPVVLYFGYARCPQLCSVVADGTVAALRQIRPSAGRDFEVVSISIDPGESAAEDKGRQTEAVRRYGHPGPPDGWNFLTGDGDSIRAVTDAAGFRYAYDPRSRQYAHPSGFLVATPDGTISRYFLGVDFPADEVARAVERAGRGRIGTTVADLLLICFRGEGVSGRYGTLIWRVLGGSVALTVGVLAGGIAWMLREEFRKPRRLRGKASP